MKNIIIITIVFFLWIFASISNETIAAQSQDANFNNEEDLAYNEFILPCYPDGIRADWNGVYGTYLDYHTNDDQMGNVNINHQVSTESTSLLAHYAALRGDQQAFEQMYDLWNSENYFLSQKYKLEHWILDSSGMKYSTDGKYANASGEEVRMVEALKIASDKFTPTGGRDYKQLATTLTEGLKGVGGGQGNFEPYSTTHNYVYSTDTGDGGVDIVDFQNQATRYVRINCLTRNTEYGDSILEVEIYGPDGTTNFALTGSATASSVEGPDFEANNAIDGSLDTRWASAWSDPQYLEIDLGAVKTINKVIIHWEYASAKSYNVDLNPSGKNYTYSTDTGDGGVDTIDFQNQITRYVRINALTRNTEYGYSILEVEIYGPDGATNLSLGSVAMSSSVEGPDFEANNAIDGSLDTRWASAWSDPQYLEIDLGAVKTINKVIIHWEYASAESYNVDTAPYNNNYVYSTDTGDGGVDTVDFQNQATRYVRINCLTRNTEYGDSILEVEIYGPDGTTNFALTGSATASSVEGPDFEANNAIDGSLDTRWASAWSDPQYLEIDLGAVKTINKVIIHWEYASAESYNVDASIYGSVTGYLLRPWFVWLLDGTPTSAPDDPAEIYLNYNNFLSYYYAVTWLGDSFYQNVIDCTLKIVLNAQNKDSSSPGKGLIKPLYDMSTQQYAGFNGATSCSTVSDFDLTIRLGAYGHLVNNQEAINAGQLFFDFIKTKYINDGVIWAGYDYSTGEPVDSWNSLDMYAFFAQLAIEYRDYDLGEKILKEKILPYQVAIPTDPGYNDGYYGAFKVPASKSEAEQNIFKDASAFANLEILKALYLWNNTDKETWTSSYPKDWATVASITTGDGGEDVVDFDTVNIRYLKILCKENNIPDFGYSIFTLQVFGPDMTDLAVNKTVSISSAEGFDYTGFKAVDDNDATRWSSELKASPQWIYVDLGENKNINKVRILWENAYAVKYDIQVGNIEAIPNQLPQASIVLIQPNPCEISQLVTFTANAIDLDGDSDIRFITWEFGDGQSSAGGIENKIQTHIYTAQGTYSVNLTVEDKAGHRITDTSSIIVNKPNQPPVADEIITTPTTPEASPSKTRFYTNSSIVNKPNQPPVAKIVAMPTAWVSPLKVRFYGDRSIDPDGQIKAYNWNFGDGSTSQIKNPTHTYYNFSSSQQQYTVTLIVKDNKGAWSSKVSTVIAVKPRSNSK